jgi:magnesium-transporting ATPase (P-type)
VLGVHEFDSSRKRMSVVVRCPDGSIRLLVKGADSALVPLLGPLYTSKGPVHSRRPSWDGHQVSTTKRGQPELYPTECAHADGLCLRSMVRDTELSV